MKFNVEHENSEKFSQAGSLCHPPGKVEGDTAILDVILALRHSFCVVRRACPVELPSRRGGSAA
ncbi:MAG: hypothetical protein PHV34_16495 [Verrucomicrobiae bacterium]|nr:hypothetical protein [Verrucomicrobiae bacterium]